jgi:hypothetical protein
MLQAQPTHQSRHCRSHLRRRCPTTGADNAGRRLSRRRSSRNSPPDTRHHWLHAPLHPSPCRSHRSAVTATQNQLRQKPNLDKSEQVCIHGVVNTSHMQQSSAVLHRRQRRVRGCSRCVVSSLPSWSAFSSGRWVAPNCSSLTHRPRPWRLVGRSLLPIPAVRPSLVRYASAVVVTY